jgi:hypothetical protein
MAENIRPPFVPDAGAGCDCHPIDGMGLREGQNFTPCEGCPYYNSKYPRIVAGDLSATLKANSQTPIAEHLPFS